MNLTDELAKLGKLHNDGVLTDNEFAQAKEKLLTQPASDVKSEDDSLGSAANRYVTFQIAMKVIGFIIFVIFFLTVFLPKFMSGPHF